LNLKEKMGAKRRTGVPAQDQVDAAFIVRLSRESIIYLRGEWISERRLRRLDDIRQNRNAIRFQATAMARR